MPSSSVYVASNSPAANSFSIAAISPTLANCIISFWLDSPCRLPSSMSLASFGAAVNDLEAGWLGAACAAEEFD